MLRLVTLQSIAPGLFQVAAGLPPWSLDDLVNASFYTARLEQLYRSRAGALCVLEFAEINALSTIE